MSDERVGTTLAENRGLAGTLPPASGPDPTGQRPHASLELREDGRLYPSTDEGMFETLRYGWMETHQPATGESGLWGDLFGHCYAGSLEKARLVAQTYRDAPYNRGEALAEGLISTDLTTAMDGSVWTHVYNSWNATPWAFMDVVRVVEGGWDNYETQKLVDLSELVMNSKTGLISTSNAGTSGMLPEVLEGMGYLEADVGEKYETMAIKDYGCTFTITDRAQRRDSKGALVTMPQKLGNAARRTVSWNIQNILTQNSGAGPTMTEDSAAAFSTTRGNLAASALTLANVETGVAAMAGIKSHAGESTGRVMNLVPRWLVVPAAYGLTAAAICGPATQVIIDGTQTAKQSNFNPLAGTLTPRVWPDISDTTSWYLFTSRDVFDHIFLAFLDGAEEPIVERQGSMGVDLGAPRGVKYRVRCPHGTGLKDWRGVYVGTA